MSALAQALVYVIQTLGSLYLLIIPAALHPAAGPGRLLQSAVAIHRARHPAAAQAVRTHHSRLRRRRPGGPVLAVLVQLALMMVVVVLLGASIGGLFPALLIWALLGVALAVPTRCSSCPDRSASSSPGSRPRPTIRRRTGQPDLRAAAGTLPPHPAEPGGLDLSPNLRLINVIQPAGPLRHRPAGRGPPACRRFSRLPLTHHSRTATTARRVVRRRQ